MSANRCNESRKLYKGLNKTFRVSPLPLNRAVLILYSSNLFIYIFNFYCWFICILFISLYPYIFPPHRYSIPHMLPAVSAVCTLGTSSSFTLFVSTPLSPYWLSSRLLIATPRAPSRIYVIGLLSFLLGLLTREDGTDTLYRNVGKQLPHDAA